MSRIKKFAVGLVALVALAGCTDADVASRNLSQAADQFEVNRRIIFLNGVTDTYIMTIEGRCSIKDEAKDNQNAQLEVTCKVGENAYKKHFLGLSDNVTYFVEHLEPTDVSVYHYRVIFKPEVIIPDLDRP